MTTYSSPQERLSACTITRLEPSDHDYADRIRRESANKFNPEAGDTELKLMLPSTLEQAEAIFDDSDAGRAALDAIAALIRMQEDCFLGERMPCWPDDNQGVNYILRGQYLGYALHEDEPPEHMMLELLQVLASQNPDAPLSDQCCSQYGSTVFNRARRLLLRRIVFNNPFTGTISIGNKNDEACWKEWQTRFNEHNRSTGKSGDKSSEFDSDAASTSEDSVCIDDDTLLRLRKAFTQDNGASGFASFARAVSLLRCSSIDLNSDHDWSTRFLFPFGISTIFTEIDKKGIRKSNIMAGQGHILYTMLQRDYALQHASMHGCKNTECRTGNGNAEAAVCATDSCCADQQASMHGCKNTECRTGSGNAEAAVCATDSCCEDQQASMHGCKNTECRTGNGTAEAAVCATDSCCEDVGRHLVKTFFEDQDQIARFAMLINASEYKVINGQSCSCDESKVVRAFQNSAITYEDYNERSSTLRALKVPDGGLVDRTDTRYLPYRFLPVFTRLREDIEALLSWEINKQDMFMHLSRMVALNFAVYLLEQQQKICNGLHEYEQQAAREGRSVSLTQKKTDDINLVLCAEDAGLRGLARLSHNRLDENNKLMSVSRDASVRYRLNNFIDLACPFLRKDGDLNDAQKDLLYVIRHACFNRGIDDFNPKADDFDPGVFKSCADFIKNTVEDLDAHRSHTRYVHRSLIKNIGMCSSSRNVSHMYYSMTDRMLRTLVLTVLGQRKAAHMKLSDFMKTLYERYHIVIGPEQSYDYHSSPDESLNIRRDDFDANEKHFKNSLARLNMLLVLSDECEYIRLPS